MPRWPSGSSTRSHGAVDVESALVGYRLGLVFDEADMRRMAATYTDNLMRHAADGTPHVAANVNGSGAVGSLDRQAPRWVNLATWDERIFTHAKDIFNRLQPEPVYGTDLLGTAFLAAHAGS